jgi:anti-sigma B factor antagonist
MAMTIDKICEGNALTLKVEGRLETTTAPELEAVVKNELDGITQLTFDFSELDYISSAGLRVLLSAQKKMNAQGSMKVKNINEIVGEIFSVTGFSEILTIE